MKTESAVMSKRGTGRPPKGVRGLSISITQLEMDYAESLGEGNVSLGVRKALRYAAANLLQLDVPVSLPFALRDGPASPDVSAIQPPGPQKT